MPLLRLPNLEGVDTVEQQIAIAKQKAGIREHESVGKGIGDYSQSSPRTEPYFPDGNHAVASFQWDPIRDA